MITGLIMLAQWKKKVEMGVPHVVKPWQKVSEVVFE